MLCHPARGYEADFIELHNHGPSAPSENSFFFAPAAYFTRCNRMSQPWFSWLCLAGNGIVVSPSLHLEPRNNTMFISFLACRRGFIRLFNSSRYMTTKGGKRGIDISGIAPTIRPKCTPCPARPAPWHSMASGWVALEMGAPTGAWPVEVCCRMFQGSVLDRRGTAKDYPRSF